MKYWTTVRQKKMNFAKTQMSYMWTHTIRYGREALAQYSVSDRSPYAGYNYIHNSPEGMMEIGMLMEGSKNRIAVRSLT